MSVSTDSAKPRCNDRQKEQQRINHLYVGLWRKVLDHTLATGGTMAFFDGYLVRLLSSSSAAYSYDLQGAGGVGDGCEGGG